MTITEHIQVLETQSNLREVLAEFIGHFGDIGSPCARVENLATRVQRRSWVIASEKGLPLRVVYTASCVAHVVACKIPHDEMPSLHPQAGKIDLGFLKN